MGRIQDKKAECVGIHLLADFWNAKRVESESEIKDILFRAAKEANNTPLEVLIHTFEPHGFTAVILLAESHIALHAWPEMRYIGVDVFTCGKRTKPYQALHYLKTVFQPEKMRVQEISRGGI